MKKTIMQCFKEKLNGDEVLVIKTNFSLLFVGTALVKYKNIPLYMSGIKNKTVFAFSQRVYGEYAKNQFLKYLKEKTTIDELDIKFRKIKESVDSYYKKTIVLDMSNLSENQLLNIVENSQKLLETNVCDGWYSEFLTEEIFLDSLNEANYKIPNPKNFFRTCSERISIEGFNKRREKAKKRFAQSKNLNKIKLARYLYTDFLCTLSDKKIEENLKKAKGVTLKANSSKTPSNLKNNPLFNYLEHITTVRDIRKDYMAKIQAILQVVAQELFSRAQIPKENIRFILTYELLKGVKYLKQIKKDIMARKQGYELYILSYNDWIIRVSNVDPDVQEEKLVKDNNIKVIKGSCAFKGKVKGTVRVVFDVYKKSKFNKGDILVTSMTRPEFISLVKKAGAIITNEGGITCHAAIISRELEKPCIIGTKNATRILKDGDLVEVDANKGEIKKL